MTQNTNIFERLVQIADIKGIKSIPDLAAFMGYDSPEKIYRLKRKPDAMPSVDMITDFSNKFEDLNLRWLLTGKGKPFSVNYVHTPAGNDRVNDHIEPYLLNTPIGKSGGNTRLPAKLDPPTDPPTRILVPQIITVDKDGEENILYVATRAAAGYLNGYADPEYLGKLPSFRLPGLRHGTYRMFEVDGDSMHPTLENKWRVIGRWVEKMEDIKEDHVHVIVTKTRGVVIKRLLNRIDKYGFIVAKSDALDDRKLYPNIEIMPEEVLEIWFVELFFGNSLRHPKDMYKRINDAEADITKLFSVLKNKGLLE